MILSMIDVASVGQLAGSFALTVIAALLIVGAVVTAAVFALKAALKHSAKTDALPAKNTYAEAPTATPEMDEPSD